MAGALAELDQEFVDYPERPANFAAPQDLGTLPVRHELDASTVAPENLLGELSLLGADAQNSPAEASKDNEINPGAQYAVAALTKATASFNHIKRNARRYATAGLATVASLGIFSPAARSQEENPDPNPPAPTAPAPTTHEPAPPAPEVVASQPETTPPVVSAQPVSPNTFKNELLSQPGETGGYPWPDAPRGELDPYGLPKGECASFVVSKLIQQGLSEKRAFALVVSSSEKRREQFEVVNSTPAAGSIADYSHPDGGGHAFFVESVNGDTMTVQAYNDIAGPYKFARYTMSVSEFLKKKNAAFVHAELPPVVNGAFVDTEYASDFKNVFANTKDTRGLRTGQYLRAGDHAILLSEDSLTSYNTEDNFNIDWQIKLPRSDEKRSLQIILDPEGRNNRLAIVQDSNDKIIRSIYIGSATSVRVEKDASITGIGPKSSEKRAAKRASVKNRLVKLWSAKSLPLAAKAAKAAVRKEALAEKERAKKALKTRKNRRVQQTQATTRGKSTNKKAPAKKPSKS